MSAEGPVRHCHQWLSNLMLSETIRLLSGHTEKQKTKDLRGSRQSRVNALGL